MCVGVGVTEGPAAIYTDEIILVSSDTFSILIR